MTRSSDRPTYEAFHTIALKSSEKISRTSKTLMWSFITVIGITNYLLVITALQLSFQMWTNQIQETLNSKKRGDAAFRAKDFTTAIDCYTQVSHSFGVVYCLIKTLQTTRISVIEQSCIRSILWKWKWYDH